MCMYVRVCVDIYIYIYIYRREGRKPTGIMQLLAPRSLHELAVSSIFSRWGVRLI